MAQRDLLVRVLGDSRSLERTFLKSTATAKVFGREVETVGRKVDRSLTGLSALSTGRGFAGGIFAAAAIGGIKSLVSAASNSQQVLGQTKVALEDAGISWERYGARVEDAGKSLAKLGFDDEETLKAISTFARSTGDVSKAIDETALAADVARARYIDLASATNIVLKASLGQAGALRRIGIDARKGASGLELLTLLNQKYGGAASKASGDAATANARLKVSLQNVQEQIGSGLLPQITSMAVALSAAADGASKFAKALSDIKTPDFLGGPTADHLAKQVIKGLLFWPLVAEQFGPKNKADAAAAGNALGLSSGKAFEDAFTKAVRDSRAKSPAAFGTPGFKPGNAPNVPLPATADQRNTFFDNRVSRDLDRVQDASLRDQLSKLDKISAAITKRLAVTKDITRKLTLEDELVAIRRQRKSVEQQIADALTARLEDAKAAKIEEKAKALEDLRKRQEAALAKLQARQFKAIGLNATGGDIIPGVENLRKQFASLGDRLNGHQLSSKLKSQFDGVGKILSGSLGKVTEESRSAIEQLFETIRGTFDKESQKTKGPLTKTHGLDTSKIIQGLGLDPATAAEIRGRLSGFNTAGRSLNKPVASGGFVGGRPIIVENHTTVELDGVTVGKSVTRNQQKAKRRNPHQRRGPNVGGV